MKILLLNNYHYPRGGAERVYLRLGEILQAHGHEVFWFSVADPEALPAATSRFFVPPISFATEQGLGGRLRTAGRILWAPGNARRMRALVAAVRPDVALAHNIYHRVNPGVLRVLRKDGVPVLHYLHDYKLCCPIYTFYRDGHICRECLDRGPWSVVRNRCTKGSLVQSLVHYAEKRLHRLWGYYRRDVARFICPSRFLLEQHRAAGLPADRLVHVPNFIQVRRYEPSFEHKGYLLYVGRLSREKGVGVLVRAAAHFDMPVHVAGDGPMRGELEALAKEAAPGRVHFHGFVDGERLHSLFQGAWASVVPSLWYENQPISILESFAYGVPVLASRLGALPELVEEDVTGRLFPPGDAEALAGAVRRLQAEPERRRAMAETCRRRAEQEFDEEVHYRRLMALCAEVLGG